MGRKKGETILESLGGTEEIYKDGADTGSSDSSNSNLPDTFTPQSHMVDTRDLVEKQDLEAEIDEIQQLGATSEEIQEVAKADLDFLAALIMPLIFKYSFPPVFKSVWTWLLDYVHQARTFPQLALGLPRGFGS
jgi:hypothetical protein